MKFHHDFTTVSPRDTFLKTPEKVLKNSTLQ
nr:MAG TPA: hypothetical protein [Caudoviricetes sp.]